MLAFILGIITGVLANIVYAFIILHYRAVLFRNALLAVSICFLFIFFLIVANGSIYVLIANYVKISKISKQLAPFGFITNYGSNGHAYFKVIEDPFYEYSIKIDFQLYDECQGKKVTIADAGVIIGRKPTIPIIPDGYNISQFDKLTFQIKGLKGEEKIGVALKNVYGDEVKLALESYVEIHKTDWRTVTIPINEFKRATRVLQTGKRAKLENISFFTNELISKNSTKTIYITKISFI